jgi:UDP-N-acetylglucosamine acyltransferase
MNSSLIHPTAILDSSVVMEEGVRVGAYCMIGPGTFLGKNVHLMSHVIIKQDTFLEEDVSVSSFSVLGGDPQDLSYQGEKTFLRVGRGSKIRESVTLNRGTGSGDQTTLIGSHALIMTGAHVAHDCRIGDHVILSNLCTLGGHVEVGDHAVLGGLSAVHQFSRIGEGAMVAGTSGVTRDVLPYTTVRGSPISFFTLNRVRLQRMKTHPDEMKAIKKFYDGVLNKNSKLTLSQRLDRIEPEMLGFPKVRKAVDFIKEEGKRPLCLP